MLLLDFGTTTSGVAQPLLRTGFKTPSFTNRFNSFSAAGLSTYSTGRILQNKGVGSPFWLVIENHHITPS